MSKCIGNNFILSLVFVLLFSAAFWRPSSMIAMGLGVLILLCLYGFQDKQSRQKLNHNEKLFVFSLICFFLSAFLSFLIGKGWELPSIRFPHLPSFLDLDLPSKYLLGALFFVLFMKTRFSLHLKMIFYSVALGSIICGIFAMYQRYALGWVRVSGINGIAEFADEASVLTLLGVIFFTFSSNRKERFLYAVSIFSSTFALLASGTRSASLGIILTLGVMMGVLWFWQKQVMRSFWVAISIVFLSFVFIFVFNGGLKDTLRVKSAVHDVEQYQEGNIRTSVGARFEMWKEAIAMFQMAPFFGLTTVEIQKNLPEIMHRSGSRMQRDKEKDLRNESIGKKHNQFLEAAAKRGIIGVFAILFVWFSYFKLFYRSLVSNDRSEFVFALCALSILFYYIFPTSFTGEPWESNVSVPVILLSLSLFCKLIYQKQKYAF